VSQQSEKVLQQRPTFLLEQTAQDLDSVIEPTLGWNVEDRPARTGFGVPGSEYEPSNAGLYDRSCAH